MLTSIRKGMARLRRDRRGNVLMIFGFACLPLTFATAMGIDYSHAASLQTKMNGIADAAALAAVTQSMMNQDATTASNAATNMFNAQVSSLSGVYFNQANLKITLTQPNGPGSRTVTVNYTAQSLNSFGGILGMKTITIGGTSTANNMVAPNIDFYMLLDTSPSMLLPATSAGLASQVAATGGCAFACHQTKVGKGQPDNICDSSGNCLDYYGVARKNGIVLRTDLLHDAVSNLTDLATQTAQQNKAQYRMGLFSFDKTFKQLWPTSAISGFNVDSNMATVKSHVNDAQILTYCQNSYYICGTNDNDTGTNFTSGFSGVSAAMPNKPGNGTNIAGDTPQAIMFLITDGMRDEATPGRAIGPMPTAMCDTLKARGIRIAVLYTEYLPASASDTWSVNNVLKPYLSPTDKISPPMLYCASPGLYYKVTTDDDISAALATLFQKAVSTARLTN